MSPERCAEASTPLHRRLLVSLRAAAQGLRWRLAAWVALVVVVTFAATFAIVYRGTGSQLRAQTDNELRGDATALTRIVQAASGSSVRIANTLARYVAGQSFATTSTVLFAVVPTVGIETNTPELFSRSVPDDGESAAVQRAENRLSGRLMSAPIGYSTQTLGEEGQFRVLKRSLQVPQVGAVLVGVGESLAPVSHAQQGVATAFIYAGAAALLIALLGSLLIGARLSRPLRRMAAVAARVDAGDLRPRIEPDASGGDRAFGGREIVVLAEAFNHMLDRLAEAFAGQREFIADASHELRTPLTVMRGQLEVLATQREPAAQEVRRVEGLVQAEISRLGRMVDDMLLLAKAEHSEFLRVEQVDLQSFLLEIWDGMTLVAQRRFELDEVPSGTLLADPDRLAQALRNLIGNAIEHTSSPHGLVRLRVEPAVGSSTSGHSLHFIVEDDGPGIPEDQLERVFDRFHRVDAGRDRASGGVGLGLAIVRAIAEAHGGSVVAGRAVGVGGARIVVQIPGFSPSAHRSPPDDDSVRRRSRLRAGSTSSRGDSSSRGGPPGRGGSVVARRHPAPLNGGGRHRER